MGDELTLVLLVKYLKCNISVISPFNTWIMYPTLAKDIILMYDGRFGAMQDLSSVVVAQSKCDDTLMKMFLNIA